MGSLPHAPDARSWTIYGCPACGYESLTESAFALGRCVRCLARFMSPTAVEVVPVGAGPAPEPPAYGAQDCEATNAVEAQRAAVLDSEALVVAEGAPGAVREAIVGRLGDPGFREWLTTLVGQDADGKVPDSEFIGSWEDRARLFEREYETARGEFLSAQFEIDRLRKALEELLRTAKRMDPATNAPTVSECENFDAAAAEAERLLAAGGVGTEKGQTNGD